MRLLLACLALGLLAACQTTAGTDTEPRVQATTYAPEDAPAALAELRGLDPATVEDSFGAPEFTRREQQVRIWRYRLEACVVELFFYPADDGSGHAVRHAEARGVAGGEVDGDACVAGLAESARS